MDIDFEKIIKVRKRILKRKISFLGKEFSLLKLSSPIEFKVSQIVESDNTKETGKKVGIRQLNFLESVKGPVVYIFELVDLKSKAKLLEKLMNIGQLTKWPKKVFKRSLAKLPKGSDQNKSPILYIGSYLNNIHSRIRQHLGLGSPNTFALQLKH